MVPLVILALVAVALVVVVLAVADGRVPADPLADAVHTTPDTGLPPAPVAADVDTVRFDTALRGYRMDDVDTRLDDLRDTLAERERMLLDLGGSLTEPAPVTESIQDRSGPAPVRAEPPRVQPEPVRAEPAHAEPVRAEPARAEPALVVPEPISVPLEPDPGSEPAPGQREQAAVPTEPPSVRPGPVSEREDPQVRPGPTPERAEPAVRPEPLRERTEPQHGAATRSSPPED